ncbi:MAG: hypothetical protein L0H54_10495 [Alcaligenaceae bacterium]|nr:hypothetical protein [Alcaligenaceae bacterium]
MSTIGKLQQSIQESPAGLTQPDHDPLTSIQQATEASVPESERDNVQALIVEELRRLHEGVLARYGLKPPEFATWKARRRH